MKVHVSDLHLVLSASGLVVPLQTDPGARAITVVQGNDHDADNDASNEALLLTSLEGMEELLGSVHNGVHYNSFRVD